MIDTMVGVWTTMQGVARHGCSISLLVLLLAHTTVPVDAIVNTKHTVLLVATL